MTDVFDIAVAAGTFSALVKTARATGLVATLQDPGLFPVIAPFDETFAELPADTLNAVLASKAKLTAILACHVVPDKVLAKDVGECDSWRLP